MNTAVPSLLTFSNNFAFKFIFNYLIYKYHLTPIGAMIIKKNNKKSILIET